MATRNTDEFMSRMFEKARVPDPNHAGLHGQRVGGRIIRGGLHDAGRHTFAPQIGAG